ncbi:hypothetical protein CH293_22980 [Rhodococcus sp. 14-2470-1b]|nr:hypothetical protein CH301_23340 [Rhodococcus sp. 15-1189-1-1a]OZF09919.1 hypothetical protein CH299_23860 [Rhodococcus sp. 14-2686-1-2]OZF44382.1 hypothetical protein CH293_22980 [Rhodococcus sp. 14-2470-1b]
MSLATAASDAWADVHRSYEHNGEGSPLARSCTRLRALNPDYPRMYAVAAMANEGKRRWWHLETGLEDGRIDSMLGRSLEDLGSMEAAAHQVATALVHAVVGRVAALVMLEGRAWDPGIDNLWIHMDSDGGIDWAGVGSPILRVLPDDSLESTPGTVTLPCEEALLVWTAHRCITSLTAVLRSVSARAPFDASTFWSLVGDSILGASTYIPVLANTFASDSARRGQALLDAFVAAGAPVRARPWPRTRLRAS